jgi:hypothetical protein
LVPAVTFFDKLIVEGPYEPLIRRARYVLVDQVVVPLFRIVQLLLNVAPGAYCAPSYGALSLTNVEPSAANTPAGARSSTDTRASVTIAAARRARRGRPDPATSARRVPGRRITSPIQRDSLIECSFHLRGGYSTARAKRDTEQRDDSHRYRDPRFAESPGSTVVGVAPGASEPVKRPIGS